LGNFEAGGTHKVVLSGDSLQHVLFESAYSNQSHFNILNITNKSQKGIAFTSKVVVTQLFDHRGNHFTLTDSASSNFVDYDKDGVKDHLDGYPTNPTKTKRPIDSDGDGAPDSEDAFPNDPNEWLDTDHDGIGNNTDPDDDGDGISDVWELKYGLDFLDSRDALNDNDGDGVTNLDEYLNNTNPNVSNNTNPAVIVPIIEMLFFNAH
jgi:hypothetical protein